jgi:hypothetical protein
VSSSRRQEAVAGVAGAVDLEASSVVDSCGASSDKGDAGTPRGCNIGASAGADAGGGWRGADPALEPEQRVGARAAAAGASRQLSRRVTVVGPERGRARARGRAIRPPLDGSDLRCARASAASWSARALAAGGGAREAAATELPTAGGRKEPLAITAGADSPERRTRPPRLRRRRRRNSGWTEGVRGEDSGSSLEAGRGARRREITAAARARGRPRPWSRERLSAHLLATSLVYCSDV